MAQVQKVSYMPEKPPTPATHKLTSEQFQCEIDYYRATKILREMLAKGLITEVEFHKIDKLNRKSFSPLLASIME
jgi:hypothetical protein